MGETDLNRALEQGKSAFCGGRYDEAVATFRAVVKAEPTWEEGWRYLGFCLNASGKFMEAVGAFDRAVELDGEDVESYLGLGFAYCGMKNFILGIKNYEKVLARQPDHPGLSEPYKAALLVHSRNELDLGNVEWAERHIGKAMEVFPDCPEVVLEKIHHLEVLRELEQCAEMVHYLEKIKPDHPGLFDLKERYGLLKEKERGWLY